MIAWLVYDTACRLLDRNDTALAIVVAAFVVLAAWGASQLFAPRAAYIEVGAMLGTIMAGNVFLHIVPSQRELVAATQKGSTDDLVLSKAREAAQHPQQLLHVPAHLLDDLEPLPEHVWGRSTHG